MLQLVYRDAEGERVVVRLDPDEIVTIGRNPGSTIRTDNPSVSRAHAEILPDGEQWVVRDLGSSNHTYVNEVTVEEAPIGAGDVVRFGDLRVKVQGRVRRSAPGPESSGEEPVSEDASDPRARRREEERERREEQDRRRRARDARLQGLQEPTADSKTGAVEEPPPPTLQTDEDEPLDAHIADNAQPEESGEETKSREEPEDAPAPDDASEEPTEEDSSRGDAVIDDQGPESFDDWSASDFSIDVIGESAYSRNSVGQEELDEAQDRIRELELRRRELELREQRHDEELDGWHERYTRVKTQLEHAEELVAQLREERTDYAEQATGLDERLAELMGKHAALESSRSESAGAMTEMKLKVVQKDRRIEELERELDMMEYELREAREHVESLQDSFNHDMAGQLQQDRELELLREVISDKENVIGSLKTEIEAQGRQIYDLQTGTGLKDLEQARQEVMDKFFEKDREVDQLVEKVRVLEHELQGGQQDIAELEARAAEQRDISAHPDHQRKVRELERAQTDLASAREEIARQEERQEEFGPDRKAQMDAEVNYLQRKNKALQDKLEESRGTVDRLRDQSLSEGADINESVELMIATGEWSAAGMLAGVQKLFRSVTRTQERLQALRDACDDGAGEGAEDAPDDRDGEMSELVALLRAEAASMRRTLQTLRDELTDE